MLERVAWARRTRKKTTPRARKTRPVRAYRPGVVDSSTSGLPGFPEGAVQDGEAVVLVFGAVRVGAGFQPLVRVAGGAGCVLVVDAGLAAAQGLVLPAA